ncbi:MAG: hypothetical protein NTZ05_18065 [Chloroflexi bacterium]|nr:hypothetical protein [Chloroflexota bacterium]
MTVDSDFVIDLPEVLKNVQDAEIVSIFFPLLRKVLLVDTRHDDVEGPIVRVAPMVNSVDERIRSLRKMRPRFGRPQSVTLVPWPKYVASVERLGILEALVRRMVLLGYADRVKDFRSAMDELKRLEEAEFVAAVTGENYQTIWERESHGK